MNLSIIIVNYNVKCFLDQCLSAVRRAVKNVEAEILVVDNNSADGSRQYFEGRYEEVKFIWQQENLGFGAANNLALQQAKGDHILFLNPDTIIGEESLEKCLAFFSETKDCGALGVRLVDGKGKFLPESKRNLPTAANSFYRLSGLSRLFPRWKKINGYYSPLQEKETGRTEVLAGAFMMLSRKAVELTGGFDTDFFMYGEDIDLSYRILQGGLKNYYLGEVDILHFKGESSLADSKTHRRQFYDAMNIFVLKHYKDRKWATAFLKSGIELGKIKPAFKKKQKNAVGEIEALVIIGTEEQIAFLKSKNDLLHYKKLIPVNISADSDNKFISTTFLENMETTGRNSVIFCSGVLRNEAIISMIQSKALNTTHLFFGEGTNCIVSSDEKDARGSIIEL